MSINEISDSVSQKFTLLSLVPDINVARTLSLKSLSDHSSVCYKTTLNTGSVRRAGAAPPTLNWERFCHGPWL